MPKLRKPVRITTSIPTEANEVLIRLAAEWQVSKSEVINLMLERGFIQETALRTGHEILIRTPEEGKLIPLPDDRPNWKPLLSREDLLKILPPSTEKEGQ